MGSPRRASITSTCAFPSSHCCRCRSWSWQTQRTPRQNWPAQGRVMVMGLRMRPHKYQARPSYDSYSAPSYEAPSYQAPPPTYDSQPKHDYDYYKHEHHHYYHAGPPRVYKVPVPVTQKPHIVHVPQNVPVKFVGVNVPVPPPVQYVGQPVEITPQYGGVYHHSDSECYDYDLDCLANVARDFGVPVPRGGRSLAGFGDFDDPYIKRKELIKSGLLLGAGVLKGALITTLINNANNNNGK